MLDCRQNVFKSISTILRKMNNFQCRPEDKHLSRFLGSLITEVELLRNDLVLVFNQNFYLRCKLDEKTQQLQTSEKRLSEAASRMQLALQMSRNKYQKQIQALKFSRFTGKGHDTLPIPESLPEVNHSDKHYSKANAFQQRQQESAHHIATLKKAKQFNELRGSPVPAETERERLEDQTGFHLEFRGLLSEEQTIFSNNRVSQQMVRSNEIDQQHSKKRRGRSANCRKEEGSPYQHRKKKSEELAELVAQQFKMQPIKEKYFSIDLM